MRALLWAALPVLFLAGPALGQAPSVKITDKSTVDQPVKKIKCKATVVALGGATIQTVRFQVLTPSGGVADPGGQGAQAGTTGP